MAYKVMMAVYASKNRGEIVTKECQQIIDSGKTIIPVNSTTFVDPDPGHKKYFTIMYQFTHNGKPYGQTRGCAESSDLQL
ncbi:hypothetical protein [uncultured Aquimarina sp.]|uniref:hypothetical protein n=1 Tax=uncultured Aquimarina sp. TaxID=575652 RepID=UPI00262FE6E5|nr:hypothetical protein [uncultured Aquimarina sp.]